MIELNDVLIQNFCIGSFIICSVKYIVCINKSAKLIYHTKEQYKPVLTRDHIWMGCYWMVKGIN